MPFVVKRPHRYLQRYDSVLNDYTGLPRLFDSREDANQYGKLSFGRRKFKVTKES